MGADGTPRGGYGSPRHRAKGPLAAPVVAPLTSRVRGEQEPRGASCGGARILPRTSFGHALRDAYQAYSTMY